MSVIGTTRKQPRVFSHDAVALADLPGCKYNSPETLAVIANADMGTGFDDGETYTAVADGAAATSFKVVVTALNGGITSATITGCNNVSNLSKDEVISIIWSPRGNQGPNDGSSAFSSFTVATLTSTAWDYGCPFTPIWSRFNINQTSNGETPANYNPLASWRDADKVRYKCTTDVGECDHVAVKPGASLYVGYDLESMTVIMESGRQATWSNIPAGSFMPVSVLTVCEAVAAGPNDNDKPTAAELKTLILATF